MVGVFDGHGGSNGVVASNTARGVASEFFEKFKTDCESWAPEQWKQIMEQLFEKMHSAIRDRFVSDGASVTDMSGIKSRYVDEKGIVRTSQGDPIHGGTTATIVIITRNERDGSWVIISADVGDSTALYVSSDNNWEFLTVVSMLICS